MNVKVNINYFFPSKYVLCYCDLLIIIAVVIVIAIIVVRYCRLRRDSRKHLLTTVGFNDVLVESHANLLEIAFKHAVLPHLKYRLYGYQDDNSCNV